MEYMEEQDSKDAALKLENQLCFPLYAAARQVVAAYTPYLKPLGLTYTQYIVFLVLWEKQEISIRALCQSLHLDSGTLTPLLKKMEETGYLTRTRSDADERVVLVKVTDKGNAMRAACLEIPEKVGKCMRVTPEEALSLYRILYKILGEDAQETPEHQN